MPFWAHRTTFQLLRSVAEADLSESVANYVEEPDLVPVAGQPSKYWVLTGDVFSLADQATRDAIDATLLSTARDALSDEIDTPETYGRNFALIVLDEFNSHATTITAILDAIDAASNFNGLKTAVAAIADQATRTPAQLKNALRLKADN